MLGRLIEEGLIDQMDDGRYKITTKGLDMIKDLESVHNVFQKQFGVAAIDSREALRNM